MSSINIESPGDADDERSDRRHGEQAGRVPGDSLAGRGARSAAQPVVDLGTDPGAGPGETSKSRAASNVMSDSISTRRPALARGTSVKFSSRDEIGERVLRSIERGQRLWSAGDGIPFRLLADVTIASFRLEGLLVDPAELLPPPRGPRRRVALRPRSRVRLRNHVAILCRIHRLYATGRRLRAADVLRWYTSISSGLSTHAPSPQTMQRIEQTVSRLNSPQPRLQPALSEIAELYAERLQEPLFPSFNGILSRLLLTAHLARCGLPTIRFDPVADADRTQATPLLKRICEQLNETFGQLHKAQAA